MREFGSEFEIEYLPDNYFRQLSQSIPSHAFTRSGREAIGMAIAGIKPGVALLPAYCCWSMVLPFEAAGWIVAYYPLNEDLSVKIPQLVTTVKELKPQVVLVMDYYGFAPTVAAVNAIKDIDKNIIVIEDFTQCLFSLSEKINPSVDCYVASIRKSLGVPDGGVVFSKKELNLNLLSEERTAFVEQHVEAGIKKKCYTYSAEASDKQIFRELQSAAGAEIKADYHLYKISPEAKSILENTDVNTVKFARKKNYEHLYSLLKDNPHFNILFPPGDNPAPFMLIIKSLQRDALQTAFAKKNVFCQVIWPLKDAAKEICPISKEMEETMLAIPIDQRYNYDDIEEIGQRINSVVL